jgi:hypothetical protein
MDIKKLYLYIVCLIALFVLSWGAVDIISSGLGIITEHPPAISQGENQASPEDSQLLAQYEMQSNAYFQKRILYAKLGDGFARALVGGLALGFFSNKLKKMGV